jgi:predicted DNA-binding transcriptional regulator AlpA
MPVTTKVKPMTLEDVCEAFGVSRESIDNWLRAGGFPQPFRPGGPNGRPNWHPAVIERALLAARSGKT